MPRRLEPLPACYDFLWSYRIVHSSFPATTDSSFYRILRPDSSVKTESKSSRFSETLKGPRSKTKKIPRKIVFPFLMQKNCRYQKLSEAPRGLPRGTQNLERKIVISSLIHKIFQYQKLWDTSKALRNFSAETKKIDSWYSPLWFTQIFAPARWQRRLWAVLGWLFIRRFSILIFFYFVLKFKRLTKKNVVIRSKN